MKATAVSFAVLRSGRTWRQMCVACVEVTSVIGVSIVGTGRRMASVLASGTEVKTNC